MTSLLHNSGPRYYGTFTLDGQERHFNVEADNEEDVSNQLMNLHPGKTVAVTAVRMRSMNDQEHL